MNNMKVAYIQLNLQKWAVVQFSSVLFVFPSSDYEVSLMVKIHKCA
jgi:hypothetical protein